MDRVAAIDSVAGMSEGHGQVGWGRQPPGVNHTELAEYTLIPLAKFGAPDRISPAVPPTSGSRRGTRPNDAAISIMVVEDDMGDRMLYRRVLGNSETDYDITEFGNATEALSAVPTVRPECILLDLNLPGCDGLEFLERLRELGLSITPSVVMITADQSRGVGVRALQAGASDFLLKGDLDSATLERAVHRATRELASRKMKLQLDRAEKLAAVGQLAAGVAHDINNPATSIIANLDIIAARLAARDAAGRLLLEAEDARSVSQMVADCQEGMTQISATVEELRTQTGTRVDGIHAISIDSVVRAAQRMLKTQLSNARRVSFDLDAPVEFPADRAKLTRVVTNLLINAVYAAGPRGNVLLSTRQDEDSVVLEVEDSGVGVPEEIRDRVFDPFFTTKTDSKNMGLGLALCASYVEHHRGKIAIDASALGGALLRVTLPLDNGLKVVDLAPSGVPSRRVLRSLPRVLIIDDDPDVLHAYERVLGREYQLTLESDPSRGLTLLGQPFFDAVICDVVMPGLNGVNLYHLAQQRTDCPPFVFCTGGALDEATNELLHRTSAPILYKPLDFDKLRSLLPRRAAVHGRDTNSQ